MIQAIPAAVTAAYQISSDAVFTQISSGLINATWLVQDVKQRVVLQKLNRIFDISVNKKIDQVTEFLSRNYPHTMRVIKTVNGDLEVLFEEDCWRCLSYVAGHTRTKLSGAEQAESVGKCLGEFHAKMRNFPDAALLPKSSVHNLHKHKSALEASLRTHAEHSQAALVRPVAAQILTAIDTISALPNYPDVAVHGDPKISNFIFNDDDRAISLVDLDTIGQGQLLFELGDAFRSWCNPAGEDTENTTFDVATFEHSLKGYLEVQHIPFSEAQAQHLAGAIETIYVELAARFCADALNESYFSWDDSLYASSCEHQLLRAKGQFKAAVSVSAQRQEIARIVVSLLA